MAKKNEESITKVEKAQKNIEEKIGIKDEKEVRKNSKEELDIKKLKRDLNLHIDSQVNDVVAENIENTSKKLKKDFTTYIDSKIITSFNDEIVSANKKVIREKNKKVIVRDIIILILLALIGYLLFLMYNNRYFDRFFVRDNQETVKVVEKQNDTTDNKKDDNKKEESSGPSLDELKSKYSSLLNNIYISESSDYINEYYNGNLTTELKNYIALNSVDLESVINDDDYVLIENSVLKNAYEKKFQDAYVAKSFKYNGSDLKYISKLNSYVSNKTISSKTNIKREIIDIKVDNKKVSITTVEGLIKDKKLYDVIDNNEIKEYKDDSLTNYQDKLNKLTYNYEGNKLVSISK